MTLATEALRCERHGAIAGWECTVCGHALCPECAATKMIPPISLLTCGLCGELAEPLLRHKRQAASLSQRVREAFIFPLLAEGFPVWLGLSMWLWVTSLFGAGGLLLGWTSTLASLFGLTRSTARGGNLELSDFQEPIHSIVVPFVRFTIAMFPAWGGALLGYSLGRPWLLWVALLITAFWTPTALIGAAAGTDILHLLNPVRVLGATARIGKDFGVYLGALVLVAATVGLSALVTKGLNLWWVPVFSSLLSQMVWLYAPMVAARISGAVLLLHGPVFGWGETLDLYQPVLGDAQPTGFPFQKERKQMSLSVELPRAAGTEDRFAALEPNPNTHPSLDETSLPSFAEQSAESIRQAIARNQAGSALDGFRAAGLAAAPVLSWNELVWLGQSATAHLDYVSAELAFSTAQERAESTEERGRARVLLARLLAERLERKGEAAVLMRRVVNEHPDTAAARFATKWLASP